jgi:cytochrome c biogenesis protein
MGVTVKSNSLIAFLRSTKLTLFILICLGITSIIGTVVIQRGTEEEMHIHEVYSVQTIRIFEVLGFFDMYHSNLYVGLLALLAVNLIFCASYRFPKDLKWHRTVLQGEVPQKIANAGILQRITLSKHTADPVHQICRALKQLHYRFRVTDEGNVIACRGISGRYGFYVAHVGLLIIMLGGLISGLFSIEGMIWLAPGEQSNAFTTSREEKIPLGFIIRCNAFHVEFYTDNAAGMPKEFRSDLTVIPEEGTAYSFPLRVNHPLSLSDFRLYQASYYPLDTAQIGLELSFEDNRKETFTLTLPGAYETKTETGELLLIESIGFEPDYFRGENGEAGSRSRKLNNPAVQLRITKADASPVLQWLFLKFPDFHGMKPDVGFQLTFKTIDPVYATGIQVAHDPGSLYIWIGSIIFISGLILILAMTPHRILIKIEPGSEILITGSGLKRSGLMMNFINTIAEKITGMLSEPAEPTQEHP